MGILRDFVRLWTRSIIELLDRLKETAPEGLMLAEIHYWRDMARVLEAINSELKQGFVETVIQIVACEQGDSEAEVKKFV